MADLVIPTGPPAKTAVYRYLLGKSGPSGFSSASTAEQVSADWDGTGKVAVITGCSAGLGLEALRVLVMRGCEVVAAVRNSAKLEKNLAPIRKQFPAAKITVLPLDLSSLASVHAFAAAFKHLYVGLNILMCNAGLGFAPFGLSKDGHEMQFATNHLGHFLLTQLLTPELVHAAAQPGAPEGRVVVLASVAHAVLQYREGIRFDAIDSPKGYNQSSAYGQSKLCNILFARELARRLHGKNIAVASCHPGNILATELWPRAMSSWGTLAARIVFWPLVKGIHNGAATQVYLATAPSIASGAYYADCNVTTSSARAKDDTLAQKLWALSEKMCAEA